MARFPRVVAVGVAHHITQRGNARRLVFETDPDRLVYLSLLKQYSQLHQLSLLGYCLMSNHVHLIAVPQRPDSMALALQYTHGRYAAYLNARQSSSGHLWQGRYYSCPLERNHLWAALRYTERNPTRAGMVTQAEQYAWSSAPAHCGATDKRGVLDLEWWQQCWRPAAWREFLLATSDHDQAEAEEIRRSTHTGRPWGSQDFVRELERSLGRSLAPRKGGRPSKQGIDSCQESFRFATSSSSGAG